MGVIGRAMTREEEAEMVALHRRGCELARAGLECPAGAHIALVSGYQGELRRMEEERQRGNYKTLDGRWVRIAED